MATRFIDKISATAELLNRAGAAGIGVLSGKLNYHNGSAAVEVVDVSSAQTLTGKTIAQAQTLYAVDGAIAIADGTALLTKAGVGVMTLAAPAVADNGKRLTIISTTNNAHTVTVPTDKGHDGTTGVNELFTFAAFAGASMTVEAYAEAWYVVALNAVTPSSTA